MHSPSDHQLPTYSVIIPCFNVAECLRDAVESALTQSHQPIEIICVDDGSTDGTMDVLNDLASQHSIVRVIAQTNQGHSAARNAGLSQAAGEWIQFLDADDVIAPQKVANQLSLTTEKSGGADVMVGSYVRVAGKHHRHHPARAGDDWVQLILGEFGITSANLWRRAAVVAAGGWSVQQGSSVEYELMFRMLSKGARVVRCHRVCTVVYARPASVSQNPEAVCRWLDLRCRIVEHMRKDGLMTQERAQRIMAPLFRKIQGHSYHHYPHACELYEQLFANSELPSNIPIVEKAAYQKIGFARIEGGKNSLRHFKSVILAWLRAGSQADVRRRALRHTAPAAAQSATTQPD